MESETHPNLFFTTREIRAYMKNHLDGKPFALGFPADMRDALEIYSEFSHGKEVRIKGNVTLSTALLAWPKEEPNIPSAFHGVVYVGSEERYNLAVDFGQRFRRTIFSPFFSPLKKQ